MNLWTHTRHHVATASAEEPLISDHLQSNYDLGYQALQLQKTKHEMSGMLRLMNMWTHTKHHVAADSAEEPLISQIS